MTNLIEEPVSLERHSELSSVDSTRQCPTVHIEGPVALTLPEYGLITFRYKRGSITARSASRREKASASVMLELTELCEAEETEPEDDSYEDGKDKDNPIDRLFDQANEDAPEEE